MFQVDWLQSALDDLTRVWTAGDAAMRQAITQATNEIDRKLSTNPYADSESRGDGERILFVSPLGVTFQIEDDDQTVSILHVWAFRTRP